jgi:CRISPR-associated protein Cas1
MKRHLNTLFVTTQGAYLGCDGETVDVRVERESRLRIPLLNLDGVVCFGQVSMSPQLMARCAEANVAVSFLTENGRFLARVIGWSPGNVVLRRQQYRRADDATCTLGIVRQIVAAKVANSRTVLLRAMRDYPSTDGVGELEIASRRLSQLCLTAHAASDTNLARGIEGEAASVYFGVFSHLLTAQRDAFAFTRRSRRPPLDSINALLSFLYTLLAHDARSACESVGLDAAVGFLHRDRPGRPGLALDLMEEFRSVLGDRLALTLINRQQIRAAGFTVTESGGVVMDDDTRKTVITAYQERKQEELMHPFLQERTTIGMLLHIQARLFARHVRGELDAYPAFIWK